MAVCGEFGDELDLDAPGFCVECSVNCDEVDLHDSAGAIRPIETGWPMTQWMCQV